MNLHGKSVILHDMCLRDGMHPKRHQISTAQMIAVAAGLDLRMPGQPGDPRPGGKPPRSHDDARGVDAEYHLTSGGWLRAGVREFSHATP